MAGQPKQVFAYQAVDGLCTDAVAIGVEGWDGAWIQLTVSGTSPSATLTVEGADQPNGEYRVLDTPNARHVNVSSTLFVACPVSTNYVKLRLASLSGSFGAGQGYTVSVTPASLGREVPSLRHQGALLHNGTTAANLVAAPGTLTLTSTVTITGGVLVPSTTYYVAVAALTLQPGSGAILGITTVSAIASKLLGNSPANAMRVNGVSTTDADAYLAFLSVDAQPKLVAYFTHAQLTDTIGGIQITSPFGTPTGAGGSTGALYLGCEGTGLQTNHAIFAQNTAHLLDSLTTLDCRGRSKVLLTVRAKLSKATVWSAAPSLTILPWFRSQESSADWARGTAISPTYLAAAGDSLTTYHSVDVDGAGTFAVSVAAMAGLASVDVWAELAPSL